MRRRLAAGDPPPAPAHPRHDRPARSRSRPDPALAARGRRRRAGRRRRSASSPTVRPRRPSGSSSERCRVPRSRHPRVAAEGRAYHRHPHAVRAGDVHRGGSGHPAAVLHEPRRPGVRAREPARGREGRAVRRATRAPTRACAGCSSTSSSATSTSPATSPSTRPSGCSAPRSSTTRVFFEYGDDSVAQLGGVHLACEQASNLLTKILEWGRLMAYLEQSTRYIPYDSRLRRPLPLPAAVRGVRVAARCALRRRHGRPLRHVQRDAARRCSTGRASGIPKDPADSDFVYKQTIKAKACDAVRGILPAATLSNVGIYGTGQAYEALLLRMRAHPLPEARTYAQLMLDELRKVIPSFLARVDRPDRGGAWTAYLARDAATTPPSVVDRIFGAEHRSPTGRRGHAHRLRSRRRGQGARGDLLPAHAPARGPGARPGPPPRRRRPRRARCAPTSATGRTGATGPAARSSAPTTASTSSPTTARSATCNATACSRSSGRTCHAAPRLRRAGRGRRRRRRGPLRRRDGALGRRCTTRSSSRSREQAAYAVSLAYRMRYVMQMNAREAMHLCELRTSPQGHPTLPARRAGDAPPRSPSRPGTARSRRRCRTSTTTTYELERLSAERAAEARRVARG